MVSHKLLGASMVAIIPFCRTHRKPRCSEVDGEQFRILMVQLLNTSGAYKTWKANVSYRSKGICKTLTEMEQDLQSAISYAGGRKVADLKHVDW